MTTTHPIGSGQPLFTLPENRFFGAFTERLTMNTNDGFSGGASYIPFPEDAMVASKPDYGPMYRESGLGIYDPAEYLEGNRDGKSRHPWYSKSRRWWQWW